MVKRKITVMVDEDLVERARPLGVETLSAVVNQALAAHVERLARRAALRELLDTWDASSGQCLCAHRHPARPLRLRRAALRP
jgi:post-segregation antitoxin (ccd killing protein)